jgi:hypothetical protein
MWRRDEASIGARKSDQEVAALRQIRATLGFRAHGSMLHLFFSVAPAKRVVNLLFSANPSCRGYASEMEMAESNFLSAE